MNITILQGAFLPVPPVRGGAVEKRWFQLGKEFAARGHAVTYVSRRWPDFPDAESIDGVTHVRRGGFDTPRNGVLLKLLDGVYTLQSAGAVPHDSDIIVTNTFWAPLLLPLRRAGRVYVDVARMPKGQMRWYRRAARLRANSTPVADAIRREVPPSWHCRVGMIPNPLPFAPAETVNLAEKQPVVLYAGRVHPEKGLHLLREFVGQMPADWSLCIVGPWQVNAGGGGPDYVQSLKAMLDSPRVRFLDPIYDAAALNALYRSASLFVYPSVAEQGETFGLAPLEAMAWGCVPVVSDLACFKDFIRAGDNGAVFDHRRADAGALLARELLTLIHEPDTRARLAQGALDVRQSHAPARIAELFLADFESLLA
ncbi:MAG: glycosyltransferase family 4 protein [Pseudomonadota bacterium]